MITIQNADAALKDYYLDAFTAQLDENISPFFSAIEKNTDNVAGKDVKLAVIRGNVNGIVAGSEDGDLPEPYKNRYVNITAPLKNIYGTIEISDKAMRASRESSGAFVNLVNAEMEGLVSSAKENFRRMLFGNGSGELCLIEEKISSSVVKVDFIKQYFVGMQVDICDDDKNIVAGGEGVFITAVDKNRLTVTFNSDSIELPGQGHIYIHGSNGAELTGLDALYYSAKIYGVKKEDEPYFETYNVDGSAPLTVKHITDIIDFMEENRNSKINMILCSYKTRRMIAALAEDSKRAVNTIDVHTGYGAITVNNIPVYAEKYCPDNRIFFVNTDDFELCQLCDWEWLEDESGKILKQVPGKAAYSATLVKYAELICRRPCGQASLCDFDPDFV